MNHETAIAIAVVLAVIVITIIYGVISGGLELGSEGIANLTDRAESDNPSFAKFNPKEDSQITQKISSAGEERGSA